jgi:3-hydroxyacyl-[acyl-carrier-protein] dehydratase
MSASFTISSQHPSLPGHFPGRPIVPGVMILNFVFDEVRKQFPQIQITGIRKLKLLQELTPNQVVDIQCRPPVNQTLRFQCYCNQQLLADGKLVVETATEM